MNLQTRLKQMLPPLALSLALQIKDLLLYTRPFRFPDHTIVQTPRHTLTRCIDLISQNVKGAYVRFGDGDIFILGGRKEQFHLPDPRLAAELREALSISDPHFLKGLGINSRLFGLEPEMGPGIHERPNRFAKFLLYSVYEYFIGQPIYSAVALHHCIINDRELSVTLFDSIRARRPIVVTGNHNSLDVCRKLLNPQIVIRVATSNAYLDIDAVERRIIDLCSASTERHHLVILSCGIMARALAKRLYKNDALNAFVFDLGSVLDAFQETQQWGWTVGSGVSSDYWDFYLQSEDERK